LRAQGLSLAEIGARMGCTKQAVYQLLQKMKVIRAPEYITCRKCGASICPTRRGMWTVRHALCLSCLDGNPKAGFGQRLLAFRLARGMTSEELASCLGEKPETVRAWEKRRDWDFRLHWSQWVRFTQFFGPEFVPLRKRA
jgi:DNA-binding CsgD family transcriptional regulator